MSEETMELTNSVLEFNGISTDTLVQQKEQWQQSIKALQEQLAKLNEEALQLNQQLTALGGAVGACDFFLQTLNNNK